MYYESFSNENTIEIAKKIAQKAYPGLVCCLTGDLGVGKTVFAKGFAEGLGISRDITSPTFTIINEYREGSLPFYHFDVYRIGSIEEMEDTGYEEYFYGEGVCLVEWGELIEDILPEEYLQIIIKKDLEKGLDYRILEIIQK